MGRKMTESEWDVTKITDEDFAEYKKEMDADELRRKRENQWYVCMSCGVKASVWVWRSCSFAD